MVKQKECVACGATWEWDCEKVHDFNKPIGKRIWPAVCKTCQSDFETKYKSGKITKTELRMEFSTISGKIAMKCAVNPGDAFRSMEKMKNFGSKRRGK